MRQKLIELRGEIDESTIIVGGFNTPLSEINRSSRQKIRKDVVKLNHTVNQLNIIDLHATTAGNTHIFLKLTYSIHQDRPHSGP